MKFVPESTLNLSLCNGTEHIIFIQSLHPINYKNNLLNIPRNRCIVYMAYTKPHKRVDMNFTGIHKFTDRLALTTRANIIRSIINLFNVQLIKSQTLYKQYYIIAEMNRLKQTEIIIIINEIRNNSNYLTIKSLITK